MCASHIGLVKLVWSLNEPNWRTNRVHGAPRPDVSPDPWLCLSNTLAICSTTVNIDPTGTERQNFAHLMLKLGLFLHSFTGDGDVIRAACIVEQSPDPLLLGKRSSTHPILMQGKVPHLNARSHQVCAAKLVVWFMVNDSSCESCAYRETQPENTHAERPSSSGGLMEMDLWRIFLTVQLDCSAMWLCFTFTLDFQLFFQRIVLPKMANLRSDSVVYIKLKCVMFVPWASPNGTVKIMTLFLKTSEI